jgi:hypothetical protein
MLRDDSRLLSRRQKLDLVSRTLRDFRLTDDLGLSALFHERGLPDYDRLVCHLRERAAMLPPSITPEFVAERLLASLRETRPTPSDFVEISCWDVDQFRPFKDIDSQAAALPLRVPEKIIKARLNALLGESESAGDWPGEDDDIFGKCSVHGRERAIAIMLKGPSVPRPMRIKDAGINADQILRLAESAAEVFVVQHVDKITEAVRRQHRMNIEALRSRGFGAWCALSTVCRRISYSVSRHRL